MKRVPGSGLLGAVLDFMGHVNMNTFVGDPLVSGSRTEDRFELDEIVKGVSFLKII